MRVSVLSSVNHFEDESMTESQYTEADGMPRDTSNSSDVMMSFNKNLEKSDTGYRKQSASNIKIIVEPDMSQFTVDIPGIHGESTAC